MIFELLKLVQTLSLLPKVDVLLLSLSQNRDFVLFLLFIVLLHPSNLPELKFLEQILDLKLREL